MKNNVFKYLDDCPDEKIHYNSYLGKYPKEDKKDYQKTLNFLASKHLISIKDFGVSGRHIFKLPRFYEVSIYESFQQWNDIQIEIEQTEAEKKKLETELIASTITANKTSKRTGWISVIVSSITLIVLVVSVYFNYELKNKQLKEEKVLKTKLIPPIIDILKNSNNKEEIQ